MAHNTKLTKAFWAVGWLALLANIYMVGLLIYWQLETPHIPNIREPIEILNANNEVAVGDSIKMTVQVSKQHLTTVTNQSPRIECESGNLVTLVGTAADLPLGEYTIFSDKYILPPKILDGDVCRFYFQTTFQVNPIKTVQEDWFSEQFTVVNRGGHNE